MESAPDCLVRYGLMGHVSWFALDAGADGDGDGGTEAEFERGRKVVVRTSRGVELGEVLVVPEASEADAGSRAGEDSVGAFRVLRAADADDLALKREIDGLRDSRFDACRRIVAEAGWPLELVDVEPLLDRTTVLHYLGVEGLDLGPIRARFRACCEFEVGFEDLRADRATAAPAAPGSPDAARGGGCGGCGESSSSGCSSCGVAQLLKNRRGAPRREFSPSGAS